MTGKERNTKIIAELRIPAVIQARHPHNWVHNSWRVLVSDTAVPGMVGYIHGLMKRGAHA